ncbi:MAG: hypothetical protein ACJAZ3_001585 [Sphingobacteriales bacterium]|jgi:hypothetical protein
MKNSNNTIFSNATFWWVIGFIVLAIVFRLIPERPLNFTPIAAIALFAGAMLKNKKLAYVMPIMVLFATDFFFGLHSTMWAVYLGFILIVFIGRNHVQGMKLQKIISGSVMGSLLFFLLTNFAVFIEGTLYPISTEGLISCFTAAIPFFKNTLTGDLVFNGVMFGTFYAYQRFTTTVVTEKVKS